MVEKKIDNKEKTSTKLKSYQRIIKSLSEKKPKDFVRLDVVTGSLIATDTTHPDYAKRMEEKKAKKAAKKEKNKEFVKMRLEAAFNRGRKAGAKDMKKEVLAAKRDLRKMQRKTKNVEKIEALLKQLK